jgi:hypothetical protein
MPIPCKESSHVEADGNYRVAPDKMRASGYAEARALADANLAAVVDLITDPAKTWCSPAVRKNSLRHMPTAKTPQYSGCRMHAYSPPK